MNQTSRYAFAAIAGFFAATSFLRRARRRGWTRRPRTDRPRVAYFVDVFANYNDPTLAGSNFEYAVPLTEMVLLGNLAVITGKK